MFTFDRESGVFLERDGDQWSAVGLWQVAFLEKRLVNGQTVFLAFGAGEEETGKAVRYLARNWRRLQKQYSDRGFGIRLSVDRNGNVAVENAIVN
jgi:hypothetical protein